TGLGAALAGDHLELGIEVEQVAVRERDALHELGHEIGGIVDELLHGIVLSVEVEIRQWLWRLRQRSRCARRRSSCTSRGGWWRWRRCPDRACSRCARRPGWRG